MKKLALTAVASALGVIAQGALAHAEDDSAYWQNAEKKAWRDASGKCWCAGYWTPAMANEECHPELVKKPEPPKVEPPAPAPVPVPPPPPPPPKKCDFTATFQSEELFAFDKAALTSAARARLDNEVLAKLAACSKVTMAIVSGHTDRIGSHQYNQKLSEQRANVVRDYLVGKGLPADVTQTNGFGKTQPVAGVNCDDKLPRKKLEACLAPNRRAVIEVQGLAK